MRAPLPGHPAGFLGMTRYLVRRLLQSVLLLVVVSIIGFAVLNLAPGGPLAAYALNPGMTQADRDSLTKPAKEGMDV